MRKRDNVVLTFFITMVRVCSGYKLKLYSAQLRCRGAKKVKCILSYCFRNCGVVDFLSLHLLNLQNNSNKLKRISKYLVVDSWGSYILVLSFVTIFGRAFVDFPNTNK